MTFALVMEARDQRREMPHEIDVVNGQERAIYARRPAWHGLGVVKEDGWFTAEEALDVVAPEPVTKAVAGFKVGGKWYEVDDEDALVEKVAGDGFRFLSYQGKQYGLVQIKDQFRFLDEVVGSLGGAHYEAAARLRKGRQIVLTIATEPLVLDPEGAADQVKPYICGFNSFDSSWAFRVKMANMRAECANMAAMILRGSSGEVVSGDWSTKHTVNIMDRTNAAKHTLGLWKEYNDIWVAQADEMIHTPLPMARFDQIVSDLLTVTRDDGTTKELDQEVAGSIRMLYEFSPTAEKIRGTVWGGLQAALEYSDWFAPVRGSKVTSEGEMRMRKQFGDAKAAVDKGLAWDAFYSVTRQDNRDGSKKVLVG